MLTDVIDAIANLREPKGSTMRKIMNQVENNYIFTQKFAKLSQKPIMKALKHGVDVGLIRKNKGKFKLGLDPRDYVVYKTFQNNLKIKKHCNRRKKCRGKKKQKRRRNARSRRRPIWPKFDEDRSTSNHSSSSRCFVDFTLHNAWMIWFVVSETPKPDDKIKAKAKRKKPVKRRKSKKRKKSKVGRKKRPRRVSHTSETGSNDTENESSRSSKQSSPSESDHESEIHKDGNRFLGLGK